MEAVRRVWSMHRREKPGNRGDPKRLPPLFTFLAAGDNVVTCKTTKNTASKSVVAFFFVFSPASLQSDLPNLEPGVARAANRPGVWMAGSATSLLLLHFYTGSVVHRCHGWESFFFSSSSSGGKTKGAIDC